MKADDSALEFFSENRNWTNRNSHSLHNIYLVPQWFYISESEHQPLHLLFLHRVCSEPEEELYLRCDSPDDAIYNNDPMCNLSIIADLQEEDVYIVPDS